MIKDRNSSNGLVFEDNGSGEPVVFIHGALIPDIFRPLLAEPVIAGRYRLISYHRRGYFGSSSGTGKYGIVQQAADCGALLQELQIDHAHVVGHSSGGAIAIQLALDFPELVHSLALLEPALMIGASAEGYRTSLRQVASRFHEAGGDAVVNAFLRARLPDYQKLLEQMLPGAIDQAIADAAVFFDGELPGLLEWSFDGPEAKQVHQPVLSVLGGHSESLSRRFVEVHQFLLRELPNALGHVVPAGGHFMLMENPAATAAALVKFWEIYPATAATQQSSH